MAVNEPPCVKEVWRWVDGYEGLYLVSNQGNVFVLPKGGKDGLAIKKELQQNGYVSVDLTSSDGKRHRHLVHRLVAKAFCSGYSPAKVVNHIDGDKTNNIASNLEWVSSSENMLHSFNVLGNGHTKPTRRMFNEGQIKFIRNSSQSLRALGRLFGVSKETIRQIKNFDSYKEINQ